MVRFIKFFVINEILIVVFLNVFKIVNEFFVLVSVLLFVFSIIVIVLIINVKIGRIKLCIFVFEEFCCLKDFFFWFIVLCLKCIIELILNEK